MLTEGDLKDECKRLFVQLHAGFDEKDFECKIVNLDYLANEPYLYVRHQTHFSQSSLEPLDSYLAWPLEIMSERIIKPAVKMVVNWNKNDNGRRF